VERLVGTAGARIRGQGDDRENRLAGLGPLAGIMTGTAVGVAAAFARPVLAKVQALLTEAVLGAAATAGADGLLAALGLTKPADWSAADWSDDILPHLGYGAAVYATLRALDNYT
jgi:hypothetical protein